MDSDYFIGHHRYKAFPLPQTIPLTELIYRNESLQIDFLSMLSLNIQTKLKFTGHIGTAFQSLFWRLVVIESKDCFSHYP